MKNIEYEEKKEAGAFGEGEDGIVGHPAGAETNSEGYLKLRETIMAKSASLTADQKREIEFNAVSYRMIEYVQNDDNDEVIEPGYFIRQYLKAANIKQNTFAGFIHVNPGNFGKLLNGTRKINHETAMILGSAFKTDPRLWLQVQDKNELLRLGKIKRNAYQKYNIDNLLRVGVR